MNARIKINAASQQNSLKANLDQSEHSQGFAFRNYML